MLLLGVGGYELLYQGTSKSGELAEETAISPEFLEREEAMVDSASDGDDTSGLAAQENSGLIVNEVDSFTAIAYDMQAPDRTVKLHRGAIAGLLWRVPRTGECDYGIRSYRAGTGDGIRSGI